MATETASRSKMKRLSVQAPHKLIEQIATLEAVVEQQKEHVDRLVAEVRELRRQRDAAVGVCDGTDAGIFAALRLAMEGEK